MLRISIGKAGRVVRFLEFGHTDKSFWTDNDKVRLVLVDKTEYPKTLMHLVAMVYPCSNNEAKRLIKAGAVRVRQVPNDLGVIIYDSAIHGILPIRNGVVKDVVSTE